MAKEHVTAELVNNAVFLPHQELPYPGISCISNAKTSGQLFGNACPPHRHMAFAEVVYIDHGHMEYSVNGKTQKLETGDTIFLPPGTLHQPVALSCDRVLLEISVELLEKAASFWGDTVPECFPQWDEVFLLKATNFTRTELAYSFHRLVEELEKYQTGWEMKVRSASLELICDLSRAYYLSNASAEEKRGDLLERIQQYIDSHLDEALNRETLCHIFFISPSTLSHLFQKELGEPFSQYIIRRRLELAAILLSSERPVRQVAEECGFQDYTNFFRAFKKFYQCSPTDWKSGGCPIK